LFLFFSACFFFFFAFLSFGISLFLYFFLFLSFSFLGLWKNQPVAIKDIPYISKKEIQMWHKEIHLLSYVLSDEYNDEIEIIISIYCLFIYCLFYLLCLVSDSHSLENCKMLSI
jgi:hypothetical protein